MKIREFGCAKNSMWAQSGKQIKGDMTQWCCEYANTFQASFSYFPLKEAGSERNHASVPFILTETQNMP